MQAFFFKRRQDGLLSSSAPILPRSLHPPPVQRFSLAGKDSGLKTPFFFQPLNLYNMQTTETRFDIMRSINQSFQTLHNRPINVEEFELMLDVQEGMLTNFHSRVVNAAEFVTKARQEQSPLLPVIEAFNAPHVLFAPLRASLM